MAVASATAILSLLDEKDSRTKGVALQGINRLMDEHWPEFAEADLIRKLEILHETDDFPFEHRQLAALVASKIYYHLNSLDEALQCSLGAGSLLDVASRDEYVRTMLNGAIDLYVKQRQQIVDKKTLDSVIDSRLEKLVNRLIQRCFDHKQYKQAIGIGLEARRIDIFEKAILESKDVRNLLAYSQRVAATLIQNRHFRLEVFSKLVDLYRNLGNPDYINMFQCLIFLDRAADAAEVLFKLLFGGPNSDELLMAYQLAFDLSENSKQQFRLQVLENFEALCTADERLKEQENEKVVEACDKLKKVLVGDTSIELYLQFLIRNNKADLKMLKFMKDSVRNSVSHSGTVIANALMFGGTTSDVFLRDNLDWLARATNWAKFSATASLGVIHRGHEADAVNVMSTYLPKDAGSGSYAEGGGLYALGLIHANHGSFEIINYLKEQLAAANNEMLRHGGCLGLGLAGMGTHRSDVYDALKTNLYQDDAVTGQAAALAMGLVMIGSASSQGIEDLLSYAHETQHEKILQGIAVGLALLMFERLEEADSLIETLLNEKDALLRRAGVFTISLAYCGSGSNEAIRKLLHIGVSDTDNDVRRAAITAVGFILFSDAERCPIAVDLLSKSFNPHVRCGSAMALAIACAGSGSREALRILEPMITDTTNFVRQGAYVASAIVLMQQNEALCPKVKDFRERYRKAISDKHEDPIAKFGANIAQGIIDAGGKNVSISMQTRTGHISMPSVVGTFIFTQFWYWFPLSHFLSLALQPTSLIALNCELNMPKVQFRSRAAPKKFAYVPAMETDKKDKKWGKVEMAVLSITAKQKKKDEAKKAQSSASEEKMDVDVEPVKAANAVPDKPKEAEQPSTSKDAAKKDEPMEVDQEPAKEKDHEILENPARVMNPQLKVMAFEASDYRPLKSVNTGGIILMKHVNLEKKEEIVEWMKPTKPKGPSESADADDDGEEPAAPQAFEWSEDDEKTIRAKLSEAKANEKKDEASEKDEKKDTSEKKDKDDDPAAGTGADKAPES